MSPACTVGLVGKPDHTRAQALATEIISRFADEDVTTIVDEMTAAALDRSGPPIEALASCDLVVSLGGDGTLLYAVRGVGSTPVVGVDLGKVGLLASVDPEDAVETVTRLVRACRNGTLETRARQRVVASGEGWTLAPALNEVLVQGPRRGPAGGLSLSVTIDDSTPLETTAEGVLVATPAGATAYNLSEGGPLVHPGADVLILTPMSGRDRRRPIVLDEATTVDVTVEDAKSALVIADGADQYYIETPGTVTIETAADPARLAGPSTDFVDAIASLRESS